MILALSKSASAALLMMLALPTLRAHVTASAGTQAGTQVLVVRLEPSDFVLGAYQGRVQFEPGSLQLVSLAASQADNGTRLYNAADTASGIVRFAGYTTSGFRSTGVLTLVVRPTRSLEQAKVRVELDVAGDLEGRSLPHERLVSARGVHR